MPDNNNYIAQQIRQEQVRQLFTGLPISLLAIIFIAGGLAVILTPAVDNRLLLAWWCASVLVCLGRLIFYFFYRRRERFAKKGIAFWESGFLLGVVLSGVLWGLTAIILFPDDTFYQVMIGFVLGGITAGAISTLSYRTLPIRLYLLLALSPLIFQLAVSDSEALNIMALMVAMFVILLSVSATRLYNSYEQRIRLGLESAEREAMLQKSISALQAQYEISTNPEMDFEEKIDTLLALGLQTFGLDTAVISRIEDESYTVQYIAGEQGIVEAGASFSLANTYCEETYSANHPCGFHHVSGSRMAAHPCYQATGIESYIGVVIFKGNERYGTLGFFSAVPRRQAFSEHDFALIQLFAQWIGGEMARCESEERLAQFKTTLDLTQDSVFMFDPQSLLFTYVNQGAMDQIGYGFDELMGMSPVDIKPQIDMQGFRQLIEPLLAKEQKFVVFETLHQHKSGKQIPVEIFLQYIEPPGGEPRFIAIVHDITERKRVDQMKNEFISTVSHELRTPLTSIRGSLGLLLAGAVGEIPEGQEKVLSIASTNTERLLHLINDILDLQRISSGEFEYGFAPIEVKSLLKSAVIEHEGYAREYNVEFKLRTEPVDAVVNGDYKRLMQVMSNLLSNAAKFSPQGQEVFVDSSMLDGKVRIMVIDSGPGVPEEFRARLFERFSQFDSSDTRKPGSTGLGLAIAKLIVEHHGGSIGYQPGQEKGSCFYFDLPVTENNKY